MKLVIQDDEGQQQVIPFVDQEITIGRHASNKVALPERNVSRRHARLTRQNGHVLVEDLGSYNGIFVNGERIQSTTAVHGGDVIKIGDYDLSIVEDQPLAAEPGTAPAVAKRARETAPDLTNAMKEALGANPLTATAPATLLDIPAVPEASSGSPPSARLATSVIKVATLEAEANRRPVEELDAADAPRLVVMNTELAGQEFACIRTELRLGRIDDSANDISLDHRSLSRTHAKLVREEDGQWRIIDLQSANGVKVNGESYANATLKGGDVIELGHVKLKFLMPGERFKLAAEGNGQARRSLPKTLLPIVALSAVVVVLGALLLLKSVHGGDANQAPPDALAKARQALEARDFSGAAGDLAGFEPRNAHQAQEAEALRRAATREAAAHAKLQQAEQALSAGDLGQAKALLASVETELQVNQLNDLKHRAQASDTAPAAAPAAAPGATGASDAVQLLAQGKAQLRSGDFEQAASTLERCLQVDPLELHCEAYLGAAYIQLDDSSKGAEHYRKFVQNAPDDPTYHAEVAKVRQRLSSYEQALRKRGGGRR